MKLTEQLRRLLKKSKLVRAQIARDARWDGGALCRFEHEIQPSIGTRRSTPGITLDVAERLASALGYTMTLRKKGR